MVNKQFCFGSFFVGAVIPLLLVMGFCLAGSTGMFKSLTECVQSDKQSEPTLQKGETVQVLSGHFRDKIGTIATISDFHYSKDRYMVRLEDSGLEYFGEDELQRISPKEIEWRKNISAAVASNTARLDNLSGFATRTSHDMRLGFEKFNGYMKEFANRIILLEQRGKCDEKSCSTKSNDSTRELACECERECQTATFEYLK